MQRIISSKPLWFARDYKLERSVFPLNKISYNSIITLKRYLNEKA